MNLQTVVLPILGVVVVAIAYRAYGWPGVALAVGGIVMWMLLNLTRMMKVLQGAANRPVGYCDSAVMLNAKLRPGVNLLHVTAMTKSLGELVSLAGVRRYPSRIKCALLGWHALMHALQEQSAVASTEEGTP